MRTIEAHGLVKSFGSVRALDGVDLEAMPGTVLGVLGPNGAGKSTAVRVLTTLLAPDGGSARVAGYDVVKDAAVLRSTLGRHAVVDDTLTGVEHLTMVGRHHGEKRAKARAHEVLERFSFAGAADRPAKTYSGGLRRRLDLAAALVASPPVLFLDEPTAGLDPRSRLELWGAIEELVGDGTTVLLTTQNLEEADRLADRLVVIDRGHVIAEGTTDELKGRVGAQRLEVTLTHPAAAFAAMVALEGMSEEPPHADGARIAISVPERAGAIMEAARRLTRAGVAAQDIALRTPTLDDVFMSLTGHVVDATHELAMVA